MGTSQVSHFAFLRYFGTDTLDLELYRCNLNPTASPSLSNESNDSEVVSKSFRVAALR